MNSKLEQNQSNKLVKNNSVIKTDSITKEYNPSEHDAVVQHELWIQKEVSLIFNYYYFEKFKCFIPGVLFEVNTESFPGWDLEDLETFFKEIGEIQLIKNQGTKTIIIYYRFYDALIAIEFFRNPQNFKEEINKDTFSINWLEFNNDITKNFSEEVYTEVFAIYDSFHNYYKNCFSKTLMNNGLLIPGSNYSLNNQSMNYNILQNQLNSGQGFNNGFNWNQSNSSNFYNYYEGAGKEINKFNPTQNNNNKFNNSSNNNQSQSNQDDDFKSGKYTCRFELLVDNDKEFQIARKLIGSKGCNMKKIVETCGGNEVNEVKLRLRGRGSGFREGPNKLESDDPLHLCVSSKHYDKYQQACQLVQELLNSVFDEYKKFCQKANKTALQKIYVVKEEGISKKSNQGRDNNNNLNSNSNVMNIYNNNYPN